MTLSRQDIPAFRSVLLGITLNSLLFLSSFSFAQKQGAEFIDSLKSRIPGMADDTNKVKVLARLSYEYYGFDTDLGIEYGEQALALSKEIGWQKGIALAYNSLGANWAIKSNYPKAFECYTNSYTKFSEIGDKRNTANALNNIGWLYIFQKDYEKAFSFLNQSVEINTAINNVNGLANNYANLGICYGKQGNYTKANEYYYKVLKVHIQKNDKTSVAIDLSNISKNKMKMKAYCEALQDGFEGLAISDETDNAYGKAILSRIIGETYIQIANDRSGDKTKCPHYSNNKQENLLRARKYLNTAWELFTQINDLSSLSESSFLLSRVYEQLGDYENAFKYYKIHTGTKDSVFSRDNSIKIVNIEKNREIELRDKQIMIQSLELKNNERLLYLFIAITIIILLFSALFITLYISKRKTNRQLEEKNRIISEMNASKDKFLSILSHDLRSPFTNFLGFTQVLIEELPNLTMEEIRKISMSMHTSATNMFRLLEDMLQWSQMQRDLIPFNPGSLHLFPLVNEVLALENEHALKKGIEITNTIPGDLKAFSDRNMIQTLIRNLVSNALKFTPKNGKIILSATLPGEDLIEIIVRDSGIGMKQEMVNSLFRLDARNSRPGTEGEPSTGLGLIICKEFIEKQGGKIWVESEVGKGSVFHFTVPGLTLKS